MSRQERSNRLTRALDNQRIDASEAKTGDVVSSDDHQRKYIAHGRTLRRAVPKARGKAARKADKLARRQARERQAKCPDCVKGLQPSTWVDDEQPNRLCHTCGGACVVESPAPTPMHHASHVVEGRTNCLNCGIENWHPAIGKPCTLARVESVK